MPYSAKQRGPAKLPTLFVVICILQYLINQHPKITLFLKDLYLLEHWS